MSRPTFITMPSAMVQWFVAAGILREMSRTGLRRRQAPTEGSRPRAGTSTINTIRQEDASVSLPRRMFVEIDLLENQAHHERLADYLTAFETGMYLGGRRPG